MFHILWLKSQMESYLQKLQHRQSTENAWRQITDLITIQDSEI